MKRMDLLLLEGLHTSGAKTSAFRVFARMGTDRAALGDLPFEEIGLLSQLPEGTRPLFIDLRVEPSSSRYWPVAASFIYRGGGVFQQLHDGAPYAGGSSWATEFLPAQAVQLDLFVLKGCVITLPVYLSRIKDVTKEVVTTLNNETKGRYGEEHLVLLGPRNAWLPEWTMPPRTIHQVNMNPGLDESGLIPVQRVSVDPGTQNHRVLAIAGARGPKLVAMSWPDSMKPDLVDEPTPFFIFYRAYFLTNAFFYLLSAYREWDFLMFSLWQWSNYQFDPLLGTAFPSVLHTPRVKPPDYRIGLPYQLAASGKKAVLLIPMGTYPQEGSDEYADFLDAENLREVLLEIQAHVHRNWGKWSWPATIGRVAMGSFSMGNLVLHKFLSDPANASFCMKELREIYMMDPPTSTGVQQTVVRTVADWMAKPGHPASDPPRARLYTQYVEGRPEHEKLLRRPLTKKDTNEKPYYVVSRDEESLCVTVAVTGLGVLSATRVAAGGTALQDDPHALFPALMVKDALSRSGFADSGQKSTASV